MTRIFTKRFFRLSPIDQTAVVSSIIRDLESTIGRHLDPGDDATVKKQVERIRKKAKAYGVL